MVSIPKKILAIKLRSLGDTVLLTASLKALTQAFPNSQIDVLVPQIWTPVLDSFPGIHRVIPFPKGGFLSLVKSAWLLRRIHYDWVINFHASPSSACLAKWLGASERSIHFHGHQDPNRYSTVLIPGKGVLKPIIERDLDTLRALQIDIKTAGYTPQVYLSEKELDWAENYLKNRGLKKPLLVLNLGASRPSKSWSLESFAQLGAEWLRSKGGSVLAIAGPEESPLMEQFKKLSTPEIQTENQLPLRSLAAVLSLASIAAGNDSGPKHLAVAVGTPTVTLFGPENPFEWHPYSLDQHPYFFIEDLKCRRDAQPGMPAWCGIHTCVIEEHRCMRMIKVESVLEKCRKVAKQ